MFQSAIFIILWYPFSRKKSDLGSLNLTRISLNFISIPFEKSASNERKLHIYFSPGESASKICTFTLIELMLPNGRICFQKNSEERGFLPPDISSAAYLMLTFNLFEHLKWYHSNDSASKFKGKIEKKMKITWLIGIKINKVLKRCNHIRYI